MKARFKNKKGLKILLSIIILSLLVGGGVFFAYFALNVQDDTSITKSEDTPDESEVQQQLEDKKNAIEDQDESSSENSPKPQESIELNVRQNGDTVIVSTKLMGVSSGSCKLSVTANSESFKSSADILYQSEFSTCAGFSIQKSELGSGTWNISLEVQTPNGTSSKNISYEVK